MTTRRALISAFVALSLLGAAPTKDPPADKKTYKYVCEKSSCSEKGKVTEVLENVPKVRHCPKCKTSMRRLN